MRKFKVNQLHGSVTSEKDISWLQVAMDKSRRVHVSQAREDSVHDPQRLVGVDPTRFARQYILERPALQPLHHRHVQRLKRPDDGEASAIAHDMIALERRQLGDPTFKTQVGIWGVFGRHGLERHRLADRDTREGPLADGAIDGTLAPGPAFAGLYPKDAKSSL